MEHIDIKKALQEQGLSFSAIGKAINKSAQMVIGVSKRSTESKAVALAICAAIKKPVQDVFPDIPRYAEGSTEETPEDKARRLISAAGLEVA